MLSRPARIATIRSIPSRCRRGAACHTEGVEQKAEPRLRLLLLEADDLEDALLHLGAVDADRAAADLVAVEHEVVGARQQLPGSSRSPVGAVNGWCAAVQPPSPSAARTSGTRRPSDRVRALGDQQEAAARARASAPPAPCAPVAGASATIKARRRRGARARLDAAPLLGEELRIGDRQVRRPRRTPRPDRARRTAWRTR